MRIALIALTLFLASNAAATAPAATAPAATDSTATAPAATDTTAALPAAPKPAKVYRENPFSPGGKNLTRPVYPR